MNARMMPLPLLRWVALDLGDANVFVRAHPGSPGMATLSVRADSGVTTLSDFDRVLRTLAGATIVGDEIALRYAQPADGSVLLFGEQAIYRIQRLSPQAQVVFDLDRDEYDDPGFFTWDTIAVGDDLVCVYESGLLRLRASDGSVEWIASKGFNEPLLRQERDALVFLTPDETERRIDLTSGRWRE